jgi:hypothetical protein
MKMATIVTSRYFEFVHFLIYSAAQVHHYDESKQPYTTVYIDVNSRKRAVNHPFGTDCITVVFRRAVYDEIQRRLQQFSSCITAVFCRKPPYTTMFTTLLRHFPLDLNLIPTITIPLGFSSKRLTLTWTYNIIHLPLHSISNGF